MPRILCTLFGHRRDSRRAHLSNNGWLAPCSMCGTRLARVSPSMWRVVDDDSWPQFAPYARAPRQPFRSGRGVDAVELGSERDGEGFCANHQAKDGACATEDRDGDDRTQQQQLDHADRTRRLLRDLFEQAPLTEQRLDPDDGRSTSANRGLANGRSEAEMFAIAFACCRNMLFRLSDHFSLQRSNEQGADDASSVKR